MQKVVCITTFLHSINVTRESNEIKMVDFQPGWDSLNRCQDVKSKVSFFSKIPKYLRKENTWRFYLY